MYNPAAENAITAALECIGHMRKMKIMRGEYLYI